MHSLFTKAAAKFVNERKFTKKQFSHAAKLPDLVKAGESRVREVGRGRGKL